MRPCITSLTVAFAGLGFLAACERPVALTEPGNPVVQVFTSPDTVTLDPYNTRQFLAYGRTQSGDSVLVNVQWSASGGSVTSGGLYTADTVAGIYVVTATLAATATAAPGATSAAVPISATSQVKNRGILSQVLVTLSTASLAVAGTLQLAAYGRTKNGDSVAVSATWSSSSPSVATVNGSGLVTAVAPGAATIMATSGGKSGTAAISVTAPPPPPNCVSSAGTWQNSAIASQTGPFEIQFDVTPAATNIDGSVGLSNGPAGAWTSLATIVRFNTSGTIDARNGGTYAATATIPYSAGVRYHVRLDVNLPAHSYDTYVTPPGSAEQVLGAGFAFRTEQAAVSTLNSLGLYVDVGSAMACNVAVSPWTPPPPAPVASVVLSPATASVGVGATVQLTATPKDQSGNSLSGRTITWASSAPALASVSATGLVTGLAAGTVTITATSEGQTGSATVTVTVTATGGPQLLYTLGSGANYYVAPAGSDANPCTA
ncbi:MAG TPA: Ig-like domain-containing protein, partial [Gemmatimonadales bacterium]|nr:Ig-like domain-containing protein [Gemmatimonadales bacterium]